VLDDDLQIATIRYRTLNRYPYSDTLNRTA
jgi:hypothetical protein